MTTPKNIDASAPQGNETSESAPRVKRRGLRIVLSLVLLFVAALVGVGAYFYHSCVSAPIDVDNATTADALGWLALRDLSKESAEDRDKLFKLYFSSLSTKTADDAPEELVLPNEVKKFTGTFMNGRDEAMEKWEDGWKRPPYLRLDYIVKPDPARKGAYICSNDVVPGPSLQERWNGERKTVKNKIEKNIQLLVLQWFTSKCNEYDRTPDEQKPKKLAKTTEELFLFQKFYNSVRSSANQAPLTRSEMLREFEATIDSWNGLTSIDQVAKALWFKDLLEKTSAEMMSLLPRATENGLPDPPRLADDDPENDRSAKAAVWVGGSFKSAMTAVKNYVYKEAKTEE